MSSSRSKQSFGVNVKKPGGLEALKKLIAQADVIVENSATGTLDDMGIGWETIRALNPRAIHVSSQLMGSRGPWASWIGYGPSTQPAGGLVHLWNYDDQEAPVVITVWGRQLELLGPDDPRIGLFVDEFGAGDTAPEPFAPAGTVPTFKDLAPP